MRLIRPALLAPPALLVFAAALSIGPAAAAPPRGNWLTTVAVTPSGGHTLGNPAAPVKLVEYISYTCSHCAHFQQQAEAPMRIAYIQPGKVQVEVRHLVRDPIDMTAAMLTHCGAPSRFFANHAMFLQNQETWTARAGKATEAQRARWTSGAMPARMRAIAGDLGFYAMMERRGYSRPAIDRCLADEAMARRLAAQTEAARELGVEGTPGFLLNGVLLAGTYDWKSLNAQLEARF